MTVAHNMAAMFSNRQLNITVENKKKTSEKLSTGYRINRSADDAAGLQISEKLRWQVRGLNKASDNIWDGLSLIQVADGALNEVHDILQRMNELSIQAANDTNTQQDRQAINEEIAILKEEINRIGTDTTFNTMRVFGVNNQVQIRNDEGNIGDLNWTFSTHFDFSTIADKYNRLEIVYTSSVGIHQPDGTIKYDSFEVEGFLQYILDQGMMINAGDTVQIYTEHDSFMYEGSHIHSLYAINVNTNQKIRLTDEVITIGGRSDAEYPYDGINYFYYSPPSASNIFLLGIVYEIKEPIPPDVLDNVFANVNNFNWTFTFTGAGAADTDESAKNGWWIQMGAQNGQGMFIQTGRLDSSSLGINNIDVLNYNNSQVSMQSIQVAIEKVSGMRSALGAQQNRLEYAMSLDKNTAENTQAAESRIRDTGMAEEMVEYSKHNILEQAGQSMLAQANRSMQGVLSLLT